MRQILLRSVGVVALAGSLATGLGVTAQAATVFVGYADNLRPSGFFPSPWLGDPGVVSNDPTNQVFDSGAIRIQNTSAAPITITNMTVVLNGGTGPTFSIWSSPLVIPAGDSGIFTQNNWNVIGSTPNRGGTGVPEPATLGLLGVGLVGLAALCRRKTD